MINLEILALGLLMLFVGFAISKPATNACVLFKMRFPDLTYYSGTAPYINETRTRKYGPVLISRSPSKPVQSSATPPPTKNTVCVFAPDNAQGVAFAVQTFTQTDAQFAVRGGDHMPIAGSNSIDE